jgi:hypothetical protein
MPSAPSHVQALSIESTGLVSSVVSPSFTSTSGNLLVVAAVGNSASVTWRSTDIPCPVSDNYGNTWIMGEDAVASSVDQLVFYYAQSCTGGAGHTVTLATTINTSYLSVAVEEISGASNAYALDQGLDSVNLRNEGTSLNPHIIANWLTPSVTNTIVVSAITNGLSNNNVPTATGTATVRTSQNGTTNQPVALATDTRSTTANVTPGFNYAPNDNGPTCLACLSFKPDSGLAQDVPALLAKGADFTVASPAAS